MAVMALESLLASLKSGVTQVSRVQASCNGAFACNPATFERVAQATGDTAEIHNKTSETRAAKAEVTAKPPPIKACTHETSVTPKPIKREAGPGDTAIICRWWQIRYSDREVEVTFDEPMTHAEILNWNRDAIAAVPLLLAPPIPSAEVKAAIREWLALTGETNQTAIEGALALADGDSHRWAIEQLEKIR